MDTVGAAHSDLVGQMLGHYRIIEILNTGGMGAVYRAEHEIIGKKAAVKVLRADVSRDPDIVRRFFVEARAATAIRHPGIVEVYDFGHASDGRAYLVMELLDGETISGRLARVGRLAEAEAATIVRGIAGALAAAHAQGIVHRDLKPDNIFLVPDPDMPSGERPKVLDFGIAKLLDGGGVTHHTQTGTFLGTPLYMAPEQARGSGQLDHLADLYSLGCIFYEMLVGVPPFVAEGMGEIIALQLYGELMPPRALLPELSPVIDALIVRMLEKEPAQRPRSAAEVADALREAAPSLSGRVSAVLPRQPSGSHVRVTTPRPGVAASPARTTLGYSAAQSVARPPSRRWGRWIAISAPILLVAVLGSYALVRAMRSHTTATPSTASDAARTTVAIRLEVDPPDATVTVDGAASRIVDGAVEVPRDGRDHALAVSAAGYQARTLTVHGDVDQRLSIALATAAPPVPPPVAPPTVATPVAPPTVATPVTPPPVTPPPVAHHKHERPEPQQPRPSDDAHTSPKGSPIEVKL